LKRTLRKIIKYIGIILAPYIGSVILYLALGFYLSIIPVNRFAQAQESTEEITIYILSNGVHTDIVVPIKTDIIDWSETVKFENTIGKDSRANLIAFGWGDKSFYMETPTWADLKFTVAFKAVFALSTSAIHATFYRQLTENEKCKSIRISREQYSRLVEYLLSSFRKDEAGNVIHIETNANYGYNDAFYEAHGRYNLFYTCNTWANDALKACDQKACLWTAFDTGIFYQYR